MYLIIDILNTLAALTREKILRIYIFLSQRQQTVSSIPERLEHHSLLITQQPVSAPMYENTGPDVELTFDWCLVKPYLKQLCIFIVKIAISEAVTRIDSVLSAHNSLFRPCYPPIDSVILRGWFLSPVSLPVSDRVNGNLRRCFGVEPTFSNCFVSL